MAARNSPGARPDERERIVFTGAALEHEAGNARIEVLTTVTLAEHGGKTTLT